MIRRYEISFVEGIGKIFGVSLIAAAHKGAVSVSFGFPKDMDPQFRSIYYSCRDYTMTSIERMYGLYKAVKYVLETGVPGDFVECGVWKGGSAMVIAKTLMQEGITNRKIYLYDTYAGMSKPGEKDRRLSDGKSTLPAWKKGQKTGFNTEGYASLEEVKRNLLSTGYPKKNLVFVKGKVEETIPEKSPKRIALLRLDTDWYESTAHEMKHLYPILVHGGVLIIDDYGHFAGAKEAIDNYMRKNNVKMMLSRVDYTGRIGLKL